MFSISEFVQKFLMPLVKKTKQKKTMKLCTLSNPHLIIIRLNHTRWPIY